MTSPLTPSQLTSAIDAVITEPDFDAAWRRAEPIEGWMTIGQGALLWLQASKLSAGTQIVEIGSYRGRSMSILATAAPEGVNLVAIDPHAGNDRGPQQWEGTADEGQSDNDHFWANLTEAGVADRVNHVREFSHDAHSQVEGQVDLLYVDGAHGYGPALDDLVTWGNRVKPGGVMLVHDCYSSIGVTLALSRRMMLNSGWTYLGRTRSMGAWQRTGVSGREHATNVARQLRPLGWFTRNVAVKAAIATKAKPVAKLLGSDGETWPY